MSRQVKPPPKKRTDPVKHKEQVRAANRARYKAVQLLIHAHQGEFDRIYAQQCLLENPPVKPKHSRGDAEQLRLKIAELEGQLADVQGAGSNGDGQGR